MDASAANFGKVARQILVKLHACGGIRCEKANAYIIQELGFDNVAAVQGGIVHYGAGRHSPLRRHSHYAQCAAAKGVESKFKGVNHVFDQRLGQRVGTEVLSRCINCGTPSDVQTDCLNTHCPRPFARRRYVICMYRLCVCMHKCVQVLAGKLFLVGYPHLVLQLTSPFLPVPPIF